MKITITAVGGSPVTLCDHGREGPSGFTITPIRKVDVLEFVQGAFAKPKARGNVLNQIVFSVGKSHDTITAAQLAVLLIHYNVPESGQVDIELEDQATHVVIHEATLEVSAQPPIGCATTFTYTLKFGPIAEAVQVLTQSGGQIFTGDGNPIFVNRETL